MITEKYIICCFFSSLACPSGYENDTDTGVCYDFIDNKVDWETAAQECDRNGGHLPSIHSEEENSFVLSKT